MVALVEQAASDRIPRARGTRVALADQKALPQKEVGGALHNL